MVLRVYLDSCIFVAYFDPNDTDKQHEKVIKFLSEIINYDSEVGFFTSDFTFTEATKVLIKEKKYSADKVHEYVSRLSRTNKIGGISFNIIEPAGSFADFFVGIQTELLEYKPGLGDAVHITIMRDNHIGIIITFNKKDFENVKVIHPMLPNELLDNVKKRAIIQKRLTGK